MRSLPHVTPLPYATPPQPCPIQAALDAAPALPRAGARGAGTRRFWIGFIGLIVYCLGYVLGFLCMRLLEALVVLAVLTAIATVFVLALG